MTVLRKAKKFLQGALRQASPTMFLAGASRNPFGSGASARSAQLYSRCRAHVLSRIEETEIGVQPFYHAFIDGIFPADFYDTMRAHMLQFKYGDSVQDRHQDNPAFMNKRHNLAESTDEVVECIRGIFSDSEIKLALLKKFFISPTRELADSLEIHDEFEYTFTKGGRFQNIHVDIPPKIMSFVFYIPERPVPPEEEERNATIFYDKSLKPHYQARFRANSVCVFAPHFYTYHGFASTIDRDVLVMFYVNRRYLQKFYRERQRNKEEPPFNAIRDAIEEKLGSYPLKEYEGGEARLLAEKSACLVNAPLGRVLEGTNGQRIT